MNTTQHNMGYRNNSTALWKDGLFGKAVAMALLALLLVVPATLRAQSDPEPATITLTADFNGEYYSVENIPSGYTAYYTTNGTEPTSASTQVANSQISVADLANGTTITVIAINNSAETTAVATATVERYLAPVAYMTANASTLEVAAIDASTGVRLRYKLGNNGSWTYQAYTDGAYTFSNPTASTEYTFRNYGPETNPEKFPSESVSINTGILFSPDYVAGTITVSVMPATQYEYIYSTTGHPEYAQDEEGEAIQYPTSETLTYTVGADEDYLYVAARNENTIVRGVYIIQRYATPTAALINYSTTQGTITPNITVTRTDASTDVRLGYTTSVGSGVDYLPYANGTYTFCNADDNDNNNFTTHALYYFRNYGPETGATRFPSKAAEVNTHSYILPAIASYIPVKSRNNTSTPASGYIYTEPGGKIYVNYSHRADANDQSSELLDPNPYDQNTYDVAYTPGDHILLNYATFKMVAGPASITVYTGNKLRSAVVTVDTQYCDKDVFCHVDADRTPHYLAISDDNSSVVDVTVFSEKCLWTRDASNNRLYQSRSNRRYYLSRNGSSNSLTAATNVNDAQGKWLKVGGKMCLYTNQTMGLCYNQGWQLSSGTQGNFEVGYRPFHRSVGVSNVYTFHSIDMISPARVGSAVNYHQPYWLAVNADHPHDLWVYARARVNKYTLPPHEYYNFKTGEGENQLDWHFWLDEYGFGHTSFSELQIGDPTPVYYHSSSAAQTGQNPEMFTFEWSVGSDNANYVTLTPLVTNGSSVTNGSNLHVARNTANALTAPRNIPLQVTVTFNNNDLASEYVDAVQGSGSSDDVVHLLLEQEETDNVIRPVHATDQENVTFQDGHYYLLRNYHVVQRTQTPYYLSGRYRDGQAYIIDTAEPERLFKVTKGTDGYYTFENVALTEEHHLQNQTGTWYLTANTTGNTDGNYWYNTPAVTFGTGSNTDDYKFTVKAYKAADGTTSYFTLTPKLVTSGASLAPHWNYHRRGTTLRYSNPYSSHLVTIEDGTTNNRQTTIETPDSTAWCLRWQLEWPTFIAPVIKVDGDGNVVITDHAGHQRHLGGYLHYQVKAAPTEADPNPDWGVVQTHTLLASSYAEGCNCTDSSVTLSGLAAGAMVRAWKTPTDDLSYFAVSETTEFTVRQVAKPTFHLDGNHITMSCATPGATIKYCLTSDFDNPATYSVPIHDYETGHVYTVRATAPNMLASETAVLHYKPQISLDEYTMCLDQSCAKLMGYIDEDEIGSPQRSDHSFQPSVDLRYFNVYYVYDNSTPSESNGIQAESSTEEYMTDQYRTYFIIPTTNIPMYKAIAIPTEEGSALYRESKVCMKMSWSQYMTFMDTIISTEPGSRAQFMTTGGENNTLRTTTDLDGRALWIGPSRDAQNTNPQLVMNYETSEYLTLRKDVANGTLSLFLDADNTHHNPTDAQYPTSNQWKWSKEPPLNAVVPEGTDENCRDYPGYYKLYTTLTETRNDVATPVTYYLVYDRTAGIWKAVEGNSDPVQATAPEGCNMQVAYHVTLFDYPGGDEYSVRTLNLYHELPAGSGNWHKLATNSLEDGIANTEAWAALSNGESINLRASFDGVYITYAPNRDINIIKPGYENMRDEANYDNYQPLSQWHYYTTTNDDGQEVGHYVRHYSQVAGYTETPMTDYNDNRTRIRWHRDGDTIGVETTHTLPAGTLQSYDARFQYTYDANHPDRITMKCIASGITAPDFSSVLHVTGYNKRVYVNHDQFKPKFTLSLFAEKPHATDEYPDLHVANRWRFVSNGERHESGEYHYFSVLPETIAQVPSGHAYLEGQPTVGGDPEYTQYSLWEVVGSNGRYQIVPVAQQGKYLVHLPDFGEEVYFRGVEPNHGAYLYDPNSAEAVTFNNNGYQPLYGLNSAFLNFGIRKFQDDAADGHDDYVVVSPYYPRTTGSTTVNAAGYLGAHNHDRDDDWSYAYVGTVTKAADATDADVLAACTSDFWSTRWTLEDAYLTAPDIEIAPDGYVTLSHRLETADNVSSSELANLHLYYKIGGVPTFTHTTSANDTERPINGFDYERSLGDGTYLYDPARKPQVTEGQTIYARAVLTTQLTTQLFTYQPHVSRPHHLTAEKCATPTVVTETVDGSTRRRVFNDEGTYNYHITYTTGDTLAVAMNHMTLDYDNVSRTYPGTQITAIKPYKLSVANADNYNYAIRAYRHNKLQSEILYLVHETPLVLNITGVEYDNADNAIVTLSLTDAFDHNPIASYYQMGYKKNNTAWTPETTQVAVVDNRTLRVTVPLGGGQVIFAAQATSVETAHPYYTASQEETVTLVSSNYTGADLTNGDGTQANPYEIANASDFVNAALKINAGASQTHGTGDDAVNRPYATAWYKVTADIDLTGVRYQSIGVNATNKKFAGHWDGGYHVLTGLDKPLFGLVDGGHIYNVVIDRSAIVGANTYTGAICEEAQGDARIYNCGVRSTGQTSSTVQGSGITGGLVGKLDGNARLVNSYNFAEVISTSSTAAGLVGYSTTASTAAAPKNIVFNSINYGNVASATGQDVYPVQGGNATSVSSISTYTYYHPEREYSPKSKLKAQNALGAEVRFLTTYEFVRYVFNANLKKAGWWVLAPTANYSSGGTDPVAEATKVAYHTDKIPVDNNAIGVWVLDTTIAPYPIVKAKYDVTITSENNVVTVNYGNAKRFGVDYPSIVNPDYEAAWRDNAEAYRGRRLTNWSNQGKLTVHVVGATTKDILLSITDMDTMRNDFNYAKVQLPYYQDLFDLGSNIGGTNNDYIVTGWKITSVKHNGTTYSSLSSNPVVNYNYADRTNVLKDIWDTTYNVTRIFAQGGYYNVPYGVTEITIAPKWGKAIYVYEQYNDSYATAYNSGFANAVQYGKTNTKPYGKTVTVNKVSSGTSLAELVPNASGKTVYDHAIVLLSDVHLTGDASRMEKDWRPFTVTTLDEDGDHEPDHVLYQYINGRKKFSPVRFDFLAWTEQGFWRTPTGEQIKQLGIPLPKGHFEITETAMARFGQFEYEAEGNDTRTASPIILNGGVMDQFVSHHVNKSTTTAEKTTYMQLGGHVYFKLYAQGIHPDYTFKTKHCPVTVTGGRYDDFYLTGYLASADHYTNNPVYLYASGGRIGNFASGGNEIIDGDVTVVADHLLVNDFYGGGVNANKAITGKITITLDSSIVLGIYAGGPKFGNMNTNKKVTTNATGTLFCGDYYGAGYGGTSLARTGSYLDGNREPKDFRYKEINTKNHYKRGEYTTDKKASGICTDYEFELLTYSSSVGFVDRYYVLKASMSKAQTNDVESNLTGCTVKGNFYGGGFVGRVTGTATSKLTDDTIHGSVFAGGK